jgi:hypothetical protein
MRKRIKKWRNAAFSSRFENLLPLFSNFFDFLKEHILLPDASPQDIHRRGKLSPTPLNEIRKF